MVIDSACFEYHDLTPKYKDILPKDIFNYSRCGRYNHHSVSIDLCQWSASMMGRLLPLLCGNITRWNYIFRALYGLHAACFQVGHINLPICISRLTAGLHYIRYYTHNNSNTFKHKP